MNSRVESCHPCDFLWITRGQALSFEPDDTSSVSADKRGSHGAAGQAATGKAGLSHTQLVAAAHASEEQLSINGEFVGSRPCQILQQVATGYFYYFVTSNLYSTQSP